MVTPVPGLKGHWPGAYNKVYVSENMEVGDMGHLGKAFRRSTGTEAHSHVCLFRAAGCRTLPHFIRILFREKMRRSELRLYWYSLRVELQLLSGGDVAWNVSDSSAIELMIERFRA